MSDAVARELTIHGHVQGVSFRYATQRVATRHRVHGWVANAPDGTVRALLEGSTVDVQSVIDFCGRGPRGAEVTRVEVAERSPSGASGFEVR